MKFLRMISFHRMYHVSSVVFNVKKQGFKLCKMVNPKSKKQWYPSQNLEMDALPSLKSLTKVKYEPGKRGIRRLAMLNKVFMKQITDMMSTGTVAMEVVGRGIEISKVNVTTDFQMVNVFWVCKGTSSDDEVDKVLNRIGGALRHELSTLRVMGEIPYIVFVKDKHEANVVELDRRLSIADYGEDYTLTNSGHLLKSEFTLDTKLSSEMLTKIKHLENEQPITEEPVPEMTHSIYGLDHGKIMNRLLGARKKSRDAWVSLETDSSVISYRTPSEKQPEESFKNQKDELADFLLKRQILQQQIRKQLRDSSEDWQLANDVEHKEDEVYYDDYYFDEDELFNEDESNENDP